MVSQVFNRPHEHQTFIQQQGQQTFIEEDGDAEEEEQ